VALKDPIASDPVFWWRYSNQPKNLFEPEEYFYWPSAIIEGSNGPFLKPARASAIDPKALDAAATWAEKHGSTALIVLHEGRVALERYWGGAAPDRIMVSRALGRSMPPLLAGFAVAEGKLRLDDPVGKHVREWSNDRRGRMTVRQLMQYTSGLEPASRALYPYGNKNMRIAYSGDVTAAALNFDLSFEPGTHFAVRNPDMQLLALVLERATGTPLNVQLSERVWKPIGAADATFQLDRPGGTVRAMCCMRATARDWARLGLLLQQDGVWNGKRVLPRGWIGTMATPSPRNPNHGAGLWRGSPFVASRPYEEGTPGLVPQSAPFLADDVLFLEGGGNRVIWFVPSRQLVVVRMGLQDENWDNAYLVNTVLRGIG